MAKDTSIDTAITQLHELRKKAMEIAFNVDESAISPDDRLGVISIIAIASRTIKLLRAMEREGQSVPDRRVGQPAHHKLGYHRFPSPEDAAMREANGEFDLC